MKVSFIIILCLYIVTLYVFIDIKRQLLAAKKTITQKQTQLNIANMQNEIIKKCISEDLRRAVKFAMIQSHPDNGGNKDDFFRFRKLYEICK